MQGSDAVLLETIIKAIVENSQSVKVNRKVDEMGVLLIVAMDEKDAGAVIGKDGSTIQSIRTIMKIVGMKNNARINVKLDVPKWSKKHHVEPSLKDQNEDTTKL